MKSIYLLLLVILPSISYAGIWNKKGLYMSQDLLQGEGLTPEEAVRDARSTVNDLPEFIDFVDSSTFGQYIECTVRQEIVDNDIFCDPDIKGNRYRVSIPVEPVDLRNYLYR